MFFTVTRIPSETFLIASDIERSPNEAVIGLIFSIHTSFDCTFGWGWHPFEYQHTAHGIGAVHQARGTFQDFDRSHLVAVDFDAMLVAPLLAFLTYAIIDDHDTVVA